MDISYLSNVALVSTFYEQKKNYFDVYLPFIVKSLEGEEVCTLEQILKNLKGIFQFGLPINVLKTIIDENEVKCFSSKRKSSNWEICLNLKGNELLAHILEDEQRAASELEVLYKSIQNYFTKIGALEINDVDLSLWIRNFLASNLDRFVDKRSMKNAGQATTFESNFVKYLFEVAFVDRNMEQIIEKMWKGMVLLDSMSTNKTQKRAVGLTNSLELFVDTNVIFSLLGLHNPILNRGIAELFQLIAKVPEIKVYAYDETIEEFDRILDVYDRIKDSFYEIEVDTVFYFLKKAGYDRPKLLGLKENIDSILSEKGVIIRNARELDSSITEYYAKLYGDLYGLRTERNDRLPKDMQKTEIQLERSSHHDAKVISNVLFLKNKRTRNIQESRAIFLTSSGSLFNDYLRISRRIENYPCVLRDIALTNWLYIINPTSDGGPQLESILGMHSSSLFVDSRIWQKYMASLKEMKAKAFISSRDFALLVSNNRSVVDFLLEAESDNITTDAIRQILKELSRETERREEIVKDAIALAEGRKIEYEELNKEMDRLRDELDEERRKSAITEQILSEQYTRKQIRRYTWNCVISFSLYVLFLCVACFTYYLQQLNPVFWLGLAVFLIPFLRSMIKHENVLETMKFLLFPNYRKKKLNALSGLFKSEYERRPNHLELSA